MYAQRTKMTLVGAKAYFTLEQQYLHLCMFMATR